jgi:hypothetical protein
LESRNPGAVHRLRVLLRPGLHPAQHALHAREQLAGLERFGDVVVRADLEPDDAIDDVARRRDHDDADVVTLAQVARERQSVFSGKADIQQDQVGQRALDFRAHRVAAVRRAHVVAVSAQVLPEQRAHARVVVDHQQGSVAHQPPIVSIKAAK